MLFENKLKYEIMNIEPMIDFFIDDDDIEIEEEK